MGNSTSRQQDDLSTRLLRGLESLTEASGRALAWLNLGMVVLTLVIVVLRYWFRFSWIALEESVLYMHAAVFTLASAYTLRHNAHVRVDIIYQRLSARARGWIDLLGTLFLLFPVAGFIAWQSLPYVSSSWAILEHSRESSGLPAVFLLKTLIPLMCLLLMTQGLAEVLRSWRQIQGRPSPPRGETEEASGT